jgi:PAS domain S-box-containing protein
MGISQWPNRSDRVTAGKFAVIYVFWSALWVVLSDYVMHLAVHGPYAEWKIESYKGIVYVLISGLILFLAVRERDRNHRAETTRSEGILQGLRQSGLLGIYEWRADGRITDANRTFLESLGYTREELESGKLTLKALTAPEYREADQIADAQIKETGRCALYEKEILRNDGSRLQVLVGQARLPESEDCGVGYALDVSQRKKIEAKHALLQQQLLQSEKLNALGQLAGGVAHDFNNLLSVIVGYASLTDARLHSEESELRENTAQILRAAEKAKNLSRKLLTFGGRQVVNPERLNLNELISEWHDMLSRVLEERVRLELQLEARLGNIEAERSQIEQVIVNLVVNARDAMPNGGVITIQTFTRVFAENAHPRLKGEYAAVRVSDTGIGMSEAVRSRIFEPFFTTKQGSGGTGLGLATVYGIVKQCKGHIEVESEVGEGSTFTVYFPAVYLPQLIAKTKVGRTVKPVRGSETILLIEDMPEIREMIAGLLRSHGYKVLEAHDGCEAVDVAASHFGPIQLVLSDVIMPNLNGPDAVRMIRQRRSSAKAIYMTGYSDRVLSHQLDKDSVILEKPIQPNELVAKIREVLDQSAREIRSA